MILPRDKIRPAIREMPTIIDLRLLADAEFEMGEYDKDFVLECLSEIYWRKQDAWILMGDYELVLKKKSSIGRVKKEKYPHGMRRIVL